MITVGATENAIYKAYPKVKPLTQVLIEAAVEQGATAEEFDMACAWIKEMVGRKASKTLISELQRNEEKSAPGGEGQKRKRMVEVHYKTGKRSNGHTTIRKIRFIRKVAK